MPVVLIADVCGVTTIYDSTGGAGVTVTLADAEILPEETVIISVPAVPGVYVLLTPVPADRFPPAVPVLAHVNDKPVIKVPPEVYPAAVKA